MSFCPIFFYCTYTCTVYDQSKPFIGIGWTFGEKIKSHTFSAPFTDQQFTHFWLTSTQCRLKAWARWADALGPHTNLCKLCTICFFMFKHWFCWKYQYNKYMFNFIDHLHFYSCELFCWSGPQCIAFPVGL